MTRQNHKTKSASELRRNLTKNRIEQRIQIRKSKKKELLSKRRYGNEKTGISNAVSKEDLIQITTMYIESDTYDNLLKLSNALSSLSHRNDIDVLLSIEQELDQQKTLSVQLSKKLITQLNSQNSAVKESRLEICRILTNLTASDNTSSYFGGGDDYYGNAWMPNEIGWNGVLLRSTNTLESLLCLLQMILNQKTCFELQQQICCVISNMAADSLQSSLFHEQLLSLKGISILIQVLLSGCEMKEVQICRNSTVALVNCAKHSYSSSLSFVNSNEENCVLSYNHFIPLLLLDQRYKDNNNWLDVIADITSLLAVLTSKEDEAVELIISSTVSNIDISFLTLNASIPSIISVLVYRISSFMELTISQNSMNDALLSICMFSLRTIGNISTSNNGKYVFCIIETHLIDLIEKFISFIITAGSMRYSTLGIDICWVAGTLLYDAGLPHHPSTNAAQTILPSLCSIVTSETISTIELKREALVAISNAVSSPSLPPSTSFLLLLINYPKFISSVTQLLSKYYDIVCTHVSLQLLDCLLRQMSQHNEVVRRMILEEEGLDLMETICEKYTSKSIMVSNVDLKEKCADLAANLIDDYLDIDCY